MENKKSRLLNEENTEMKSVNDNIYDMFTIDELEQRLQTSAALAWVCGTEGNTCNPICSTVGNNCSPIINCSPVVGAGGGGGGGADNPLLEQQML